MASAFLGGGVVHPCRAECRSSEPHREGDEASKCLSLKRNLRILMWAQISGVSPSSGVAKSAICGLTGRSAWWGDFVTLGDGQKKFFLELGSSSLRGPILEAIVVLCCPLYHMITANEWSWLSCHGSIDGETTIFWALFCVGLKTEAQKPFFTLETTAVNKIRSHGPFSSQMMQLI